MSQMDYSKASEHILREMEFKPEYCRKCESIMSQGNGYLGLRAAAEENYTQTMRGFFIAGTYNAFDASEVSELPNAADCTMMEIYLNQERFSLETGRTIFYSRELNLKNGLLTRKIRWESPEGNQYDLEFERFVSIVRLHLYCMRVRITPLELNADEAEVSVLSGIDGRITNSGSREMEQRLRWK